MTLTDEGDGTSVLSGPVVDQAALHGQLQKLRDLGVTLLSLAQLVPSPVGSSERPDLPHDKSRCVQARHEHPGANQ
jgi:hypothetical protein